MNVITVSQVNSYIKALLDESAPLKNIYIAGEISNCTYYYRSGHIYLTLKDEKSQLKCVMFSSYAQRLKFKAEDGMRVICRGRISVYEKDGAYQFYIEDMQPDGAGALNVAFEQLKQKLSDEGLFDPEHKKPLPDYPKKIGVATSDIGAAIEDIKNISKRRYPLCELVIVPTIVQGELASADIVKSVKLLDSMPDIDLIIVGRGGGSLEDLWAFNTEPVARAVYECSKPVISAVGHETDFTISDFAADLRAPTPSAAAELALPDINAVEQYLSGMRSTLSTLLKNRLYNEYQRLDSLTAKSRLANPAVFFGEIRDRLKSLSDRIISNEQSIIEKNTNKTCILAGKLDALSPLAVLSRGYGILYDGTKAVKSAKEVKSNDCINVRLQDGNLKCTVNEVTEIE
jgi:exodeoxyribonuclease VII large subunit